MQEHFRPSLANLLPNDSHSHSHHDPSSLNSNVSQSEDTVITTSPITDPLDDEDHEVVLQVDGNQMNEMNELNESMDSAANTLNLQQNGSSSSSSSLSSISSFSASSAQNVYAQHLEWYSSKPIPHLLEHKLTIKPKHVVSSKVMYHPQLRHFILVTITSCNDIANHHKKWCLDLYERDARPFLWSYAFDPKSLRKSKYSKHKKGKKLRKNRYEEKRDELFESLHKFEFFKIFHLASDLIVADLKSIGIDIGLGYDNMEDLGDILQEIVLRESTMNPQFQQKTNSKEVYFSPLKWCKDPAEGSLRVIPSVFLCQHLN